MEIVVKNVGLEQLDMLMKWRMIVLHEVFSVPIENKIKELEQQNRCYYQLMLPSEGHISCFAYAENKIVGCGGMCIYQEMPSPDNYSGKCAYIMNIYTCPQFRKQGVGKAIVKWLLEQAHERHITKIYLETSELGRILYQKIGFTAMQNMMEYKE